METLKNIKVGDQVIVIGREGARSVCSVEKVTKTQFVIASGSRFTKAHGMRIGDSGWSTAHAALATPEEIKKVKIETARNNFIGKLRTVDWKKVATDQLIAIRKILDGD